MESAKSRGVDRQDRRFPEPIFEEHELVVFRSIGIPAVPGHPPDQRSEEEPVGTVDVGVLTEKHEVVLRIAVVSEAELGGRGPEEGECPDIERDVNRQNDRDESGFVSHA